MNVGRSHIAASARWCSHTSGPPCRSIVLFAAGRQDPLLIVSGEIVAVEVVRALVGSIGIVAAVPVTTLIAVGLIGRRLPFIGEEAASGTRHQLGLRGRPGPRDPFPADEDLASRQSPPGVFAGGRRDVATARTTPRARIGSTTSDRPIDRFSAVGD